ncbi:MAG TPA: OmpA family protein [Thermoanaerobaculia bacterium]|nr:OmpA family protein [Thermoanaerobaculia bacterium]
MRNRRKAVAWLPSFLMLALLAGCASSGAREPYVTKRDRTWKGAGIGAAAGAAGAVLMGKREADEILAGAAIGAVVGGGVGAYMDAQQEKLARIPGTEVERVDEDTLLVHFENDVLFGVDSSALDSDGRMTLEDVSGVLEEYAKTAVVVQGHTDSTGSEEHNQDLSERRAESVRRYLAGLGVDPDRLAMMGFGETSPVASNDSDSGRQQNRRVDILLRAKAGPVRDATGR